MVGLFTKMLILLYLYFWRFCIILDCSLGGWLLTLMKRGFVEKSYRLSPRKDPDVAMH